MQKFLEELYGMIDIQCTSPERQKSLRDDLQLTEVETEILKRLGDGGTELLFKYDKKREQVDDRCRKEAFIQGFRYGVRLITAAFDDEFV